MSTEEQHVALPKLYGAPAYGRPPRSEDPKPRPFDPDDLPIVVHQNDEERDLFQSLPEEAFRAGGRFTLDGLRRNTTDRMPSLRPIAFSLRALASRLFGGS